MEFISVCSGIEAASVAWAPLGWRAAAFSEIEPFPCSVLKHHYPHVPNHGDMRNFNHWPDHATAGLLCGGTPCQSFSIAGLRKGLDDPRGNLMLTFGAIAARHRTRWVVWENVAGVLSSDGGRDFGAFLGMLGLIGYGFAFRVLDAQHFGVPQRRRRVFVVGCLGDWRSAAAVLFERHSLQGHPAPSRQAGQGTSAGTLRSTQGGSDVDHARARHLVPRAFGGNNTAGPIEVATALNACATASGRMDFESETFIAFDGQNLADCSAVSATLDSGATNHNRGMHVMAFDPTQITHPENRSNPKAGDPCHTLAKGMHAPAIAFDCTASGMNGFGVGDTANPSRGGSSNTTAHQAALVGAAVRRLTPRECERLQGFPDDWTAVPHRGKPAADGPRYKALGNSWAVPCAAWIGRRIAAVDALQAARAEAA